MHITRLRKTGEVGNSDLLKARGGDEESRLRFYGWSVLDSGCWEWRGARHSFGYGQFTLNRRARLAHRVSFEVFVRPLQPGEVVCHRCDNPPCINPDHLFAGTVADNMADMHQKGRHAHGGDQYAAKLSDADVLEIRHLKSGGMAATLLAERFGIRKRQIYRIVNREQWKHLP